MSGWAEACEFYPSPAAKSISRREPSLATLQGRVLSVDWSSEDQVLTEVPVRLSDKVECGVFCSRDCPSGCGGRFTETFNQCGVCYR
jgi:hypothetical protein